jgi:hypothetical protein
MKTADLIEKSKRELKEFNLLVAEFNMRIKKENPSYEEYEKNEEDFHALNKQKKELDADRKQVVHHVLGKYDGSKKQQLELLVEQYDGLYELYMDSYEKYDERGFADAGKDESIFFI